MDGPSFDVTVDPTYLHHVYESNGIKHFSVYSDVFTVKIIDYKESRSQQYLDLIFNKFIKII
jgi:L-lysine 2,3-aminomutase